jgi:hypothetical protein
MSILLGADIGRSFLGAYAPWSRLELLADFSGERRFYQ